MKIKVKYFGNEDKVKELYKNAKGNANGVAYPFKKYSNDFCYDVVATSCNEIHPGVFEYGLGIGLQIDRESLIKELLRVVGEYDFMGQVNSYGEKEDYLNKNLVISIDFRPRSSVRDTGLVLCNCEGTIDEGYTNEIKATFYHVIPTLQPYKVGDKVGQIKLGFSFKMDFEESNDLGNQERGLNGFGSTSK